MSTVKKTNSIAKSISGILLIAVLLTAACPTSACAADDNPTFSTLDVFPALRDSSDTMDVNDGTINTLYGGGTVKDNKGKISSSLGTVYENHGTIENLSAGHAGTNYGVINRLENTGSLGENDTEGTVLFVGMGNVIIRNDGTVQANAGNIADNYGTVGENYGTVLMHDGQIVTNDQTGTVTFETKILGDEAIPAKGRIEFNKGNVRISSGTVTIKENTGNIEINNATVTVEKNSGSITLGVNAALTCGENTSDGEITKTDKSAGIVCGSNDGLILDETVARYRIVFAGDDGRAEILICGLEKDGVSYTLAGGGVIFTLPPEYECSSAMKLESGNVNTWRLNAFPAEGDTEFTIICRKCSPCDSLGHDFSTYIPNGDATCTKDGTKTAVCANGCGATDTIADTGSAKGHTEVTDEAVAATCTATGLTEGKHCSVCGAVLVAQTLTEKIGHTFSGNTCTDCGYTKPSSGGSSIGSSSSDTVHKTTVSDSTHGSVSIGDKTASAGDTVTIDVTPDKGYTLETITVTDENGKEIPVTEKDGVYSFVMPEGSVKIEATFMEDNTMLNYFVDVTAQDYYYDAVLWAAENGITSGVDAVHFDPNGTCTRAQAVTFLWRAAGCPAVEIGETFSDVVKGIYYEKAVAWALANGITSGTSATTFSPDADCTREQIVTFLHRANKVDTLNIKNNPFNDVKDGAYYYNAVLWAAENDITDGTSATTFSPDANCTRAQIVTFLYRFMNK